MSTQKCPNCEAGFVGYNDHDTGRPTPDKWLCDTYVVINEQPVLSFTFEACRLVRAFLLTHSDPSAKKLADIFDKE